MEEKKWDELSDREKAKRIKKFNAWGIKDEEKIRAFFDDNDPSYDEYEEPKTESEVEVEVEEEQKKESKTEEEPKKQVEVHTENPTDEKITYLENEVKSLKQVLEAQTKKIDKTYEILEAQGKEISEDEFGKLFGNEKRYVPQEKENTRDSMAELFKRR